MSIVVLTLFCVSVHYNALGRYIKLFALYRNIFFMKVIKTDLKPVFNNWKPVFQEIRF